MPSKAREAFDNNMKDVYRLLELHTKTGGDQKGRRYGLEVLNKSAIVLITAFWEAYCEDIAAEAVAHLVAHAVSAEALPKKLKLEIANELKAEKNELAVWQLSNNGWREYLRKRLDKIRLDRNRDFNTPKSQGIDKHFEREVGVVAVTSSWKFGRRNSEQCKVLLDEFVSMRGDIAHRGAQLKPVTRKNVTDYLSLVEALAARTGGKVKNQLRSVTPVPLWPD